LKKIIGLISLFFRLIWKLLTVGAAVISGLFLLATITIFLLLFLYQPATEVPDGCALVLAPRGEIVEQKSPLDPMSRLINNLAGIPLREELQLQEIIDGIRAAAADSRIKLLVLAPDHLTRASLNQLQDIGRAIDQFKESGKAVIAIGDNFSQGQYYLAAWGDEIYLNPMGAVNLLGFGVFRLYMRDLLDNLAVNFHVFKVGTFKSALEPFIRNNMSPAAKKANQQWLTRLWDQYRTDIADHRAIPPRAIDNAVNRLADNMRLANGDSGQMALNNGLIDGLKTRHEMRQYLESLVGSNREGTSFKQIDFNDYLTTITPSYSTPINGEQEQVGIIVARGDIVYGEAAVGQIGSDALIKQIRQARKNKQIKALVLRLDSGGGSAFASELIRQELLLTQQAGKPVVISMGAMAASGAYWISADADTIFASPTTLTGSIGIFGALPTFENSLARIGVFNDGTGTTELAGAGNPTRPLPEDFSAAMQAAVERGYHSFIDIVARGREMQPEQVENIAEGRVWDGASALELGLVDQLGTLEDAVSAAAALVGLPAERGVYLLRTENPAQMILKSLGAAESILAANSSPVLQITHSLVRQAAPYFDFLAADDPQHMYSHCLLPKSATTFSLD
jgi:protease-4